MCAWKSIVINNLIQLDCLSAIVNAWVDRLDRWVLSNNSVAVNSDLKKNNELTLFLSTKVFE